MPQNKIEELSNKIVNARNHYYNDQPIMSDHEFDTLLDELIFLDPAHPTISSVGASNPVSIWEKVKHQIPMGSLDKVNNPTDLQKWYNNICENDDLFLSEKLDGISIELIYDNGKLIQALTRGDGIEGENILANVCKMSGVQITLNGNNFAGSFRGEIILTKSNHKKYFSDKANPRNAASGISKRFDGAGSEYLDVLLYQVIGNETFLSELDQFQFLKKMGCKTPNFQILSFNQNKLPTNLATDIWNEYQSHIRDSLDYEIDGLVIRINNLEKQLLLGSSHMKPKSAIAYKFPNQMVRTTVKEIVWETGSMGRCVPVCWVEPVSILGSIVQKASVYNIAYIKKLGLDVGAEILLTKCGEIIPRIEKVVKGTNTIVSIPTNCPMCDETLVMDGEYLICSNTEDCVSQIEGRLRNWIKELKVLEVGKTLIKKLVESGLVETPADFYCLTVEQLASLERMGKQSATVVHQSIWKHNPVSLDIFLGGLSIPLIGKASIQLLMADGNDTLEKIQAMTQEEMGAIKGMGPARAEALYLGLQKNAEVIQELILNGVIIKGKEKTMEENAGKLAGKSFVLTGKMENKRAVLVEKIEAAGGEAHDKVRAGTTYLVIADPESTSTKAQSARKLGTKLISEEQLLEMV